MEEGTSDGAPEHGQREEGEDGHESKNGDVDGTSGRLLSGPHLADVGRLANFRGA